MNGSGEVSRRAALGIGVAWAVAACGSNGNNASTDNDPLAVATDAYVFGYPLVLMDATRASGGPVNRFVHADSLPTPADRMVVRMNLDTLYSQAWLDLASEPLVLQVPAMDGGRYWLMQLLDAWSNTAHNPSSVRPRTQPPFTYLLTGPGWSGTVPAGVTHLPLPTNTVWLIGRVQVNGHDDLAAVRAIQDKLKLAPLSAWQANPDAATPGLTLGAATKKSSPARDVAAMTGPAFFAKMCALLPANQPATADQPAMRRFASIGIAPGATPTADPAILNAAAQAAKQRITDYHDPTARNVNGWSCHTGLGSYGTNYPLRAATAAVGLGANLAEDALYPRLDAVADTNGTPRRFRLHFPAGGLPPVDAFWSLTAYDADSFLIANPADIYAVGHQPPIRTNPDGSTDIVVQHADPGPAVPRGNWLPIPATGKFSLTLRLYAPKPEAANGTWRPPTLDTTT
ncbi:DUF1254 domain-containing protein [Amycolatopsis anabasis]|uniref:DUF1254 domain-containing protein n=1 Tax=Amycolatopsis anabasis TaxID=1840409 RepID=UPI001C552D43|nr:DUF1254 domain-containing protein [Amycolatopsis anabasis]